MKKKQIVQRIKLLLDHMTDLIVEIRSMDEDVIELDIASDMWYNDSIISRLDYLMEVFKDEEFYKSKAFVCCPVDFKSYKEMKQKEMGKGVGYE